jgi:hypothetical protein
MNHPYGWRQSTEFRKPTRFTFLHNQNCLAEISLSSPLGHVKGGNARQPKREEARESLASSDFISWSIRAAIIQNGGIPSIGRIW